MWWHQVVQQSLNRFQCNRHQSNFTLEWELFSQKWDVRVPKIIENGCKCNTSIINYDGKNTELSSDANKMDFILFYEWKRFATKKYFPSNENWYYVHFSDQVKLCQTEYYTFFSVNSTFDKNSNQVMTVNVYYLQN